MRWTLATRTGWTLEYIDGLPLDEIYTAVSIWGSENRARSDNAIVDSW